MLLNDWSRQPTTNLSIGLTLQRGHIRRARFPVSRPVFAIRFSKNHTSGHSRTSSHASRA